MIQNQQMTDLCDILAFTKPQWDRIHHRFTNHPYLGSLGALYDHQYAQHFSEIHLDIIVEDAARDYQDLQLRFNVFQRPNNSDYNLIKNRAGRLIACSNTGNDHWEYDRVGIAKDVPLIFEMKIRKWSGEKIRKRIKNGKAILEKGSSVSNQLRPEIYSRKLAPLENYYDAEVGYALIISRDQYWKVQHLEPDHVAQKFLKNNGMIIPFYTDRHDFKEQVREKVAEFGLKLRK